jgi:hypothetical protein
MNPLYPQRQLPSGMQQFRGQELTTQGQFPINQLPLPEPVRMPVATPGPINPDWLNVEWLKPITQEAKKEAGVGFTLPGFKSQVKIPEVPDIAKTQKAIENLQAPGAKKTDALATVMQALAATRWDDRSAVGTNLFNIGAAMLGGVGLSRQQQLDAEREAEKADLQMDLKKLELDTALNQQEYQNRIQNAQLQSTQEQLNKKNLAPKIVGNSVLYGVELPSGDIQYQTQKVGESKFERLLKILEQTTKNSTVDIASAVMQGQVPAQFAPELQPKILQYQQEAFEQLAGSMAMADDKTKQQMINMYVNQQLMADPEVGPMVQKLQEPLRQNAIMMEAINRGL